MNRFLRVAAVVAAMVALGGCIVAPAPYPAYGYAGPPAYAYAPVYPPAVGLGIGACFGCGRFHRW